MPKVLLILGIAIGGVIFGVIAMLQEHVLPVTDVMSKQMGVWAFIWLLVDRLLQYLLKFKKDKTEEHLEVIRLESVKQTKVQEHLIDMTGKHTEVLTRLDTNLMQGLTNQKDIYKRYLREPRRKRK
jgi:hypothetical protein